MRTLRILSRRLSGYLVLACVLAVALVGCGSPASTEAIAPTATPAVVPGRPATSPAEAPTSVPPSYKFLRKWGSDGQLSSPIGVAVDVVGNVYVADTGNGRIQVFGPRPYD